LTQEDWRENLQSSTSNDLMALPMKLSLRHRMLLTLAPLLIVLALVGGVGFALLASFAGNTDQLQRESSESLRYLGGRIDQILRENYDSVLYMERLHEALERIDSSFQFALAGREEQARKQYEENRKHFETQLKNEQANITLPGEGELVKKLTELSEIYRRGGDDFFAHPGDSKRRDEYFGAPGKPGLLEYFKDIKSVSSQILWLNQDNMEKASRDARSTAAASLASMEKANLRLRETFTFSLFWFGIGLVAATMVAGVVAVRTVRALLKPIRAVTESSQAIGAGNLDQVVPVVSDDELGQLAGAFNAMARQLREYRQSQKSHLLRMQLTSQATVNAFPHPVLVVDQQGQVAIANPAACSVLGVVPAGNEPTAQSPWQPPEPLRQPLAEALRDQRNYLPSGFDHTFVLRTVGEEHTYLPRILTIRDNDEQTLGAAVLLEDVTRFRLLDQVKSNLVATVSHELKTPLTGIRLALHLLLEEGLGPLSPKQVELLLDARDNSERLLGMINNLLDLARLESGGKRLDVKPERPADLLHQAANAVRHRAEDKGIQLQVEAAPDLPDMAADAEQIGHALHNLLDNALRYTDPGGRIHLGATAANGKVVLEVADTGKGIPPQYLPHVFDRFFRVPGQSEEGGTGLGLAIVREVVQAHGGSVACESPPGQGTTFTLTVPVWKS
jgi:two-component system, NtrC family, sensor histidine kinase KinB